MFRIWYIEYPIMEYTETLFSLKKLASNLTDIPLSRFEFIIYEG